MSKMTISDLITELKDARLTDKTNVEASAIVKSPRRLG